MGGGGKLRRWSAKNCDAELISDLLSVGPHSIKNTLLTLFPPLNVRIMVSNINRGGKVVRGNGRCNPRLSSIMVNTRNIRVASPLLLFGSLQDV